MNANNFKSLSGLSLFTAAVLGFAIVSVSPAGAATRQQIKRMVVEEALLTNVPPSLALAVAKTESNFRGNALSSAGARGVMQIMPRTARGEFGVAADELWNPRLNIQLGIDYLESLIRRYNGRWDLALSHYNGGTVESAGFPPRPHTYTSKYVNDVLRWEKRYRNQAKTWAAAFMNKTDLGRPLPWVDEKPAKPRRTRGRIFSGDDFRGDEKPARPRRTRGRVFSGDDFDESIEARRLRVRPYLDDFTPIVRWTSG